MVGREIAAAGIHFRFVMEKEHASEKVAVK